MDFFVNMESLSLIFEYIKAYPVSLGPAALQLLRGVSYVEFSSDIEKRHAPGYG